MPWLLPGTVQHFVPLCGFQGLNPGYQTWQRIYLLVKSSHWSKLLLCMLAITGNLKLANLNNSVEFFPVGFSTEQAL